MAKGHGGKRNGAGRPTGAKTLFAGPQKLSFEMKATLAETARTYTPQCIHTLATLMLDEESPAAVRVVCANSLLDRAWGKAVQPIIEAEFSRISDGELLEDLGRQARELGVEIDVAYRVIEGDE